MGTRTICRLLFIFLFGCLILAASQIEKDPLYKVATEKRDRLRERLRDYVAENRNRDWAHLYDLVSATGRGKTDKPTFVERMKVGHGTDFANDPDLLEFQADRTDSNDSGIDVYGCAKAKREGEGYDGIAVVHAVFEHDDWFFTGWTFVGGECTELADKDWKLPARIKWTQPMEELRTPK
ncbi:MAG: hypothetical protein ACRD59_16545 [Candidatus Acidiferrales bacterium]